MILLTHNNNYVVEVKDLSTNVLIPVSEVNPIKAMFLLSKEYSDAKLAWCHISQKENLNFHAINDVFHLKNMMLSYCNEPYLPEQIGYVEDSPFLKVNKSVKYPTWLMSSEVGVIHTSQLIKFKDLISTKNRLDYALNSIAKIGMSKGLFCYSEPNLLIDSKLKSKSKKTSIATLFKFVKQHYKTRWVFLLLINFIWHDKRFPISSLFISFFYKKPKSKINIEVEGINSNQNIEKPSIDVIIPTIGRKKYLYDVLKDSSRQTLLPKQVIIVEQNPDSESNSELDYIKLEEWPFKINHKFIHQTGACNARNLAMQFIESEYVFFADDDIRFNDNVFLNVLGFMNTNKIYSTTLSCLRPNDKEIHNFIFQWPSFGSGCSIVKHESIKGLKFNMAFEHGFGEDTDFGVQLRNKGIDVIYFPEEKLTHLKAPIGGFRFKHVHPWETESIQPKPSPTVMLNRLNNTTVHQLLGYKITLFIKFYKDQHIKNPFAYYKKFKKQWKQSVYWANKLKEDNN